VDNASDLEKAYYKRLEEAKDSVIDYKFHATLKNPAGNIPEIVDKMLELGITSVKVFTTYSDSNRRTYDNEIIELLKFSKVHQFTVLVHAENDDLIQPPMQHKYAYLPEARPTISETSEVLKLAEYVRTYGGLMYIVHVSSGETVKALIEQYDDILHKSLFIESCPHYFLFDNNVLKTKSGYLYTMAPPLRSKDESALLRNLFTHIDTIGTDHCPFSAEEKDQKYLKDMPLGIGSVEHSLEVMYSMYGLDPLQKMTSNVARIHHLPNKGMIKVGYDADLVITDSGFFDIDKDHSKSNYNVYQNYETVIRVISTLSHGKFVIKDRKLVGEKGHFIGGEIK
jgi:dihydropyrimidinase